MTVDSEAIFALVDRYGTDGCPRAARGCDGGRLDRRARPLPPPRRARHGSSALARAWTPRGAVRLHAGRARGRREALGTTLRKTQVDEGRLLSLVDGELVEQRRWAPTGATARIAGCRPSAPRTRAARASIASGRSPRPRPARSSGSRRARRPRPPRGAALVRGTGTPTRCPAGCPPCGRPATRRGASRCGRARPSTRPSSAGARAHGRAPRRRPPRARGAPPHGRRTASRRAAESEPNVCQMSDFEAIRPRRSSRSCRRDAAELGPELGADRAAPRG